MYVSSLLLISSLLSWTNAVALADSPLYHPDNLFERSSPALRVRKEGSCRPLKVWSNLPHHTTTTSKYVPASTTCISSTTMTTSSTTTSSSSFSSTTSSSSSSTTSTTASTTTSSSSSSSSSTTSSAAAPSCTPLCTSTTITDSSSNTWTQKYAECHAINLSFEVTATTNFGQTTDDCAAVLQCANYADGNGNAFRLWYAPSIQQWSCDVGPQRSSDSDVTGDDDYVNNSYMYYLQ